jgi:2-oxoisovalerate dehydrogenase E2 component (dihydrolipoyl transacylase)
VAARSGSAVGLRRESASPVTGEDVKDFLVPDLGEGLEDATITTWSVAIGDDVELNQTICCLETAKAEVEIPSPYAGRIVELNGAEGDVLEVGSLLVRIDTRLGDESDEPAAAPATPDAAAPASTSNGAAPTRTPVLVGYGAEGGIDSSRRTARPAMPTQSVKNCVGRPRAAPSVRKLAAELVVDLGDLWLGSGSKGLITREDVLRAAGRQPETGASADRRPVHGVRARMAHRVALSRKEIPDAHASVGVDCSGLLQLRDRLRVAAGDNGDQITWFVLILRLVIIALTHNPIFNSTWVDTADGPQVHVHNSVDLGFGVATQRGLLVPVVFDAQEKTTMDLAAQVAELIRGARDGRLRPTELQGSTFTVSNFGALGLDEGVPVINYPEAAILGMGSLKPRAVIVDDALAIRPTMTLTCAFDHRIADGAQVASFLCETRELIESPELALLSV